MILILIFDVRKKEKERRKKKYCSVFLSSHVFFFEPMKNTGQQKMFFWSQKTQKKGEYFVSISHFTIRFFLITQQREKELENKKRTNKKILLIFIRAFSLSQKQPNCLLFDIYT